MASDEVTSEEAGAREDASSPRHFDGGDGSSVGPGDDAEASGVDAARADGGNASDGGVSGGGRDASASDARTTDSAMTDAAPDASRPGGTPVFVVAGYQRGRAYSTDLGVTWHLAEPGIMGPINSDDEFVLSGASYGKGLFVAVGYQIWTSPDGQHWEPRTNPVDQWLGSVNFGLDMFVGAGGNGYSAYSNDGITWMKGGDRKSEASDESAFGNGAFMATTRDGNWWRSTDGKMWNLDSGGHDDKIVWCVDHFADTCPTLVTTGKAAHGEGVWVRVSGERPSRSTDDGKTWSSGVSVGFAATSVTFGYAP